MEQPVTIKFFFSLSNRDLPADLKLYGKRVREFLSEYERRSRRGVKVEVHDPKVDSDEEEWAQKYGMHPLQLPSGERIYCGLVFLSADQEERIELLDLSREALLEYDVTRIIHRLQSIEKKVVGIMSTLPVFGAAQRPPVPGLPSGREPWFFVTELRKTYDVREIGLSEEEIDDSVDLLVIIHPKGVSEKLQYAVDQYILRGGNALIFVDPFCVSDAAVQQQRFMQPSASSLEKLFGAWGISMDSSRVLADIDHPTRLRSRQNVVENNPVWISASRESFHESDVVISQLESLLFPVAGAIKKTPESTYEYEPMVYSGKNAALIDSFMAGFGASAIRREFIPAGERFHIMTRVSGRFKTAFPAGPPKGEESEINSGEIQVATHLESGKDKSTIMVLADADMLADEFYVRKSSFLGFAISRLFNDNLNLFSNACEVLTGGDDLVGLRSRGKFERPFTAVVELERQAQERWLAKENELVKKVERTNRKLRELQKQKDASQKLIISPEQEAEIAGFKEERRRINRELKEVRKNLRADIEKLGILLKGINIFLMPFLVSLAGIAFAIYRERRIRVKL